MQKREEWKAKETERDRNVDKKIDWRIEKF